MFAWAVEGECGEGSFLAKNWPLWSQAPEFPPVSRESFFRATDTWEVPS